MKIRFPRSNLEWIWARITTFAPNMHLGWFRNGGEWPWSAHSFGHFDSKFQEIAVFCVITLRQIRTKPDDVLENSKVATATNLSQCFRWTFAVHLYACIATLLWFRWHLQHYRSDFGHLFRTVFVVKTSLLFKIHANNHEHTATVQRQYCYSTTNAQEMECISTVISTEFAVTRILCPEI